MTAAHHGRDRDEGESALATATALALLAGCQGDGGTAAAPTTAAPAPVWVEVSPADGATDVSPRVPLEISVTDGELTGVHVVDGAGVEVTGTVGDSPGDPAVDVWTPDTPLAYGAGYMLTARAQGADDAPVEATTTFTTVTPETLVTPSIGPLDGQTVGVGMPIRVWFEEPVADRAAVESALRVTSSTPTDGAWNWFSDTEVHFRPSEYWPENTDVTLDAALYGVDFGGGVWGEEDRTVFSGSVSGTSPSPTPAPTGWRSTTATSCCRPSRSAPAVRRTPASTARTSSPR